jgi:hypothetical protein
MPLLADFSGKIEPKSVNSERISVKIGEKMSKNGQKWPKNGENAEKSGEKVIHSREILSAVLNGEIEKIDALGSDIFAFLAGKWRFRRLKIAFCAIFCRFQAKKSKF